MLDHWSYTCLRESDECPRKWKWQRLEGNENTPTQAMQDGGLVHQLVEEYSRRCIQAGREQDRRLAADLAESTDRPAVAEIIHRLPDFLVLDRAMVLADEAGVEREFELTLPGGDLLKGRIDRLDWNQAEAELVVTDYKGGYCYEFPEDPPRQLRLYGWAAMQLVPGAQIVTLVSCYLGSRTKQGWSLPPDDELLQPGWIEEWIARAKARTEFPELPGTWCESCGRLQDCAKARRLVTAETIGGWVADAIVYEAAADQCRQIIDKYRRENTTDEAHTLNCGDLVRGDFLPVWAEKGEAHYEPQEIVHPVMLLQVLEDLGEEPRRYVSWNAARLGHLAFESAVDPEAPGAVFLDADQLKRGGQLADMLQPVTPRRSAGWRKVKEAKENDEL